MFDPTQPAPPTAPHMPSPSGSHMGGFYGYMQTGMPNMPVNLAQQGVMPSHHGMMLPAMPPHMPMPMPGFSASPNIPSGANISVNPAMMNESFAYGQNQVRDDLSLQFTLLFCALFLAFLASLLRLTPLCVRFSLHVPQMGMFPHGAPPTMPINHMGVNLNGMGGSAVLTPMGMLNTNFCFYLI